MPYRFLALAALMTAAALPAAAQNLLQNATFDGHVAPWTGFFAPPSFSPIDANGFVNSGSMRGTAMDPAGGELFFSECIPVSAGTAYVRSYDYLIEPPDGVTALVHSAITWYSDAACSDGAVLFGTGGVAGEFADGAWHPSPHEPSEDVAPPLARGARLELVIAKLGAGGSVTAHFDNVVFKVAGTCAPLSHVLCLNGDRFQVEAAWGTASATGRAAAVELTDDTGYFWFFSPQNVEVVIKVLDACVPFGRFWVFAGGLTDVQVEIVVTDTKTSHQNVYHNTRGEPFAPLQDTRAFETCP